MRSVADILVLDDEASIVDLISEVLTDEGYSVRTARDAASARALIATRHPDLVLLDMHLPGKTGDMLARELREEGLADVPLVLMTADAKAAHELSMDVIAFCLIKPFDLDDLIDCVATYIRKPH